MKINKQTFTPDADEELDDSYIHKTSTEEFVEIMEQASQEMKEEL